MSKERVNIRMDKEIFDFYDEISERENISRSEAMIIGLSYYKDRLDQEEELRQVLDSLEGLDLEEVGQVLRPRACKKSGKKSGQAHYHIGRELNTLNILLNPGRPAEPEGDQGDLSQIDESLNQYNQVLQNLARPIEILSKNFNYHKACLEKIKRKSELIIDYLGFHSQPGTCGQDKPDYESLKEEIKAELRAEILEDLKK